MVPTTRPEATDLTVEEAAARLRLHPESIRRWLRAGERFPHAFKVSATKGGWRIPVTDVERIRRGGRA
jgi:excisionase family DNA binding protein